MVISIGRELEAILTEEARRRGVSLQDLAESALRDRFLSPSVCEPCDDWERQLRGLRVNAGVSLSDADVSSEGIYE